MKRKTGKTRRKLLVNATREHLLRFLNNIDYFSLKDLLTIDKWKNQNNARYIKINHLKDWLIIKKLKA